MSMLTTVGWSWKPSERGGTRVGGVPPGIHVHGVRCFRRPQARSNCRATDRYPAVRPACCASQGCFLFAACF
eukprot:1283102-Prymnesium_polylepis.1